MAQLTEPQNQKPDLLSRPVLLAAQLDWEKIIYILFIILAIVSRFFDLGSRVMSHDESLHTQFSYQFYDGQGFNHTPLMHGPLLFHLTAVSYWLFGDNDLTARIPVAILGVIVVAVPYFFRDWVGRVGALFISFVFLISPYTTYYARYIRHDTLAILWGLIIFISIIYYMRERKEKYLWWFAAALSLLFATKEVSFIYVAIFGSFLIIRILPMIITSDWIQDTFPQLRRPFAVLAMALLLIAAGGTVYLTAGNGGEETAVNEFDEPFAADPTATVDTDSETLTPIETAARWGIILGIVALSGALVLGAQAMRPHIDQYAEFDLIILFTTLVLPFASPLLINIAGFNPQDYSMKTCELNVDGNALQMLVYRARFGECWGAFFSSPLVITFLFVTFTLVVAVLVGMWWNASRWVVIGAIFYAIFFIFFTSVFTNISNGVATGIVGSLGYWLEQQEVQRGSQPPYYYLLVVPFYEFLAVIFSYLAIRRWTKKQRINQILGYWITLVLASLVAGSLGNWYFNRFNAANGAEDNALVGALIGGFIFGAGIIFWYFVRQRQIKQSLAEEDGEERPLSAYFTQHALLSFVPFVTWWLILTWGIYSYAGEKMPWLSIHFVIPMGILVGWYMNDLVEEAGGIGALLKRQSLLLIGAVAVFIVALTLAIGPLLLGEISFGNQGVQNLNSIGRFLGGLIVAGAIFYGWQQLREQVPDTVGSVTNVFGLFIILALLTVRFNFMANFVNEDSAAEYMVYAHGAPAAKTVVLEQVEELSMRLNGDKTMQVAFGGSGVAWPFTWYLREYPNRTYYGENPTNSLVDTPVVIVGRTQHDNVDRLLSNTHTYQTYTYLWWPMEQYRGITWNAVFGNPNLPAEQRVGFLTNANTRQALWDIFFYRDYEQFSQTFGGTYTPGNWPLRDDLRLYIRRDVLSNLWDYGVTVVSADGLEDPYAEGELFPAPELVLDSLNSGIAAPRNVAIGPNGRIFVADSGNHQIQVFEADGSLVTAFGEFGNGDGQFNEPWGIAVDASHVYIADTWNHRVQKFTVDGEFVDVFGASGAPADVPENNGLGLFFGPRDIHLYGLNELLVTDTGNHRFQLLTRDGEFIAETGTQGASLGQMNEPVGFTYGLNGDVYLADTWNGRIQQFTNDLVAYNEWRVNAWQGNSINNKPYMTTDTEGRLYVTDPEGARILIFDSVGNYLGRFGQFGPEETSFGLINGIFIDRDNNLYVADSGNSRILKFGPIFGGVGSLLDQEAMEEMDEVDEEEPVEEEILPTDEPVEEEIPPTDEPIEEEIPPTDEPIEEDVSPTDEPVEEEE